MDEYDLVPGSVSAFQWDLTRAEQDELEESLKRKRPCGFAPWPQEEGNETDRIRTTRQRTGKQDVGKPRARRRQ